jgi:hypothetical protein
MMTCAPKFLFQAFCLWDGGELPTAADLELAWGPAKYPWGAAPALPTMNFDFGFEYGIHKLNYERPVNNPADRDATAIIPPPGRRPKGNGPLGHADIGSGIIPWIVDAGFFYSGSFEQHVPETTPEKRRFTKYGLLWNHRYWASGARCIR